MATAKKPPAGSPPAKKPAAKPKAATTTTAKDVEAFGAHVRKGMTFPNQRKYATAEEMFDKAKEYFEQLDGPPTMSGCALHLNFSSTQRFRHYCVDRGEKEPDYLEVHNWVKTQLESYHERRIASGHSNSTGSIFWLKAVAGYQDVQTINQTVDQKVTYNLDEMNFAERMNRAQALIERALGRVEGKGVTVEGVAERVADPAEQPAQQLIDDVPVSHQPVEADEDDWIL